MTRKQVLSALCAVLALLFAAPLPAQWLNRPDRGGTRSLLPIEYQAIHGRALPPLRLAAERPTRVPNQITVKFRGPHAMSRVTSATSARPLMVGMKLVQQIPQLDACVFEVPSVERAMEALKDNPDVLWVQPRLYRYPLSDPNDPAYNEIDRVIATEPEMATWYKWDSHMINCSAGWSIWPGRFYSATSPKGSDVVRIAVIDTGIDYTHPDFINAGGTGTSVEEGGQLVSSEDATIFNGIETPGAADDYGHGTHVAGIAAAATNNGIGTVGNAYNAEVLSIKVVDQNGNGSDTDIAQGIVYAVDHGAMVVNMSLGSYEYSQIEQDAVNYAWRKNVLCVAAAGNDGNQTLNYPASMSKVLGVAATSRIAIASYSNYGPFVGICAPGGDFDYDIMWLLGVYSTLPTYYVTLNDPNVYGAATSYDYLMGTSMASPQVAGAAALYEGYKGFTRSTPGANLLTWQALQRTSIGDGGWSPYAGYGLLDILSLLSLDDVSNARGDTAGGIVGQVRYRGTPVINASVVAKPSGGGSTYGASTRVDGGYRIIGAPADTYTVTATYFGETQKITGVTVTAGCDMPGVDFNVAAFPAGIVVQNVVGNRGATVNLQAMMTRTDTSAPVEDARLWFEVDGTEIGSAGTDANGQAVLPYQIPSEMTAGTHAIAARYYGEGAYQPCSGTGTLTVGQVRFETSTAVPDRTGEVGSSVTLQALLTRQSDGSPVAGKTISFSIDGAQVGSGVTDQSGLATYVWTVTEGTPSRMIQGDFAGDDEALPSSGTGTLTVNRGQTKLAVRSIAGQAGTSVKLDATLACFSTSTPIGGRTVNFSVSGTAVGSAATNASGLAETDYAIPTATVPGPLALSADFAGDDNYLPSSGSGTLNVVTVKPYIWVADRTVNVGLSTSLYAYFRTTPNMTEQAGKTVTFKIDGTAVGSLATDSQGAARYPFGPVTLPTGSHVIRCEFAGDAQVPAGYGEAPMTVLGAKPYIWVAERTVNAGYTASLYAYFRTLPDMVAQSGKTVTFKVDGTVVGSIATDAQGVARYPYDTHGVSQGSHTIRCEFAGDSQIAAGYGEAPLTVLAAKPYIWVADTSVNAGYAASLYGYFRLWPDLTPQPGKTVTFKVDGTAVGSLATDSQGVARCPYDTHGVSQGSHTIRCEFAGDAQISAGFGQATLTVLGAKPYIWVAERSVAAGGVAPLYAYFRTWPDLTPQPGKTVSFRIDGTTVASPVTDASGVARYSYNTAGLSVGVHTIRCSFAGDAQIVAGYGEAPLTIK